MLEWDFLSDEEGKDTKEISLSQLQDEIYKQERLSHEFKRERIDLSKVCSMWCSFRYFFYK